MAEALKLNSSKHVLIVEDAGDIQSLLTKLLKGNGYTVSTASDGKEALDILSSMEQLPGLILLDLMMPGMDGFQFRQVQEQDAKLAGIPIVVMTAFGDVQAKAMAVGAKGFLKKPFSNIDLILQTVGQFF